MRFEHPQHEETFGRVREYLAELFDADDLFFEDKTRHYYVRYGSTVLEISVDAYGSEDAMVVVMAYCVQGVDLDRELLLGLMELNHTLPFGAFSVVGDDVFYSYSLLGRTLKRSQLFSAVAAVANTSDEYDDRIVAKFGGQRALDRIRDTGGKQRRQESVGG